MLLRSTLTYDEESRAATEGSMQRRSASMRREVE